jgi:ADP-ribose pyrophosphatase YjhB (NUDIX family)
LHRIVNPREHPTRPWVGIGVLAFRGEDVLLIRRGRPPRMGEWSLPGGAQRIGERAEDCARRELREETGIEVGALDLLAVVDAITPGEAGNGPRFHYTIIDYLARWESGTPRAGGDVTDVAWCASADPAAFGLWPEAVRVIGLARERLGFLR